MHSGPSGVACAALVRFNHTCTSVPLQHRSLPPPPVQNADDNSYSPDAGLPVLELVTSSCAVTCLNNESGFSPDDVVGICEVGGSKKQGKAGFTG